MWLRLSAVILIGLAPASALADVGAETTLSVYDAWISGSFMIHFNVDGRLIVDKNEDRVYTISVDAGKHGVIDFGNTAYQIQFQRAANFITLGSGATLTIQGGLEGAGFSVPDQNPAASLTINGPIAGAVLGNTIRIGNNTLVLPNSGGLHTVTATTGRIEANGPTTITVLNVTPGAGQSFTYAGSDDSTVGTITPSSGTFIKEGTGRLTVTNGFDFGSGVGTQLAIKEGAFVDSGSSLITFGDDAEKIDVSAGATYTTSRSITGHAVSVTNFKSAAGSTVNFACVGTLLLTATADDDFQLLGTVNIQDGCTVQMAGAFRSQFGSVNIANAAAWTNTVPESSVLFVPGSTVLLQGSNSGSLTVDGQDAASRIAMGTTTNTGSFTIDRGVSGNMVFRNVALSRCTYASAAGGPAEAELTLAGIRDDGENANWFVIPSFAANAGPDAWVGSGQTFALAGFATGGSGQYAWSWTPTDGLDDPNTATPTCMLLGYSADVGGPRFVEYTLTVTDLRDNRTATDTVTITVGTAPPDPRNLCGGGFSPDVVCSQLLVAQVGPRKPAPMLLVTVLGLYCLKCVQRGRRRW